MKTYGDVEVQLQSFLISALDGSDCLASRSYLFTFGNKVPGTYRVGPRDEVKLL
jgi:hypothetical protein